MTLAQITALLRLAYPLEPVPERFRELLEKMK